MHKIQALAFTAVGAVAGLVAAAAFVKRAVPSRGDEDSDEVALVAVREEIKLVSRAAAFRGGSLFGWFGGIALDLREATLAPTAHFSVHCLFGGVAIRVPPGWRVESSMNAVAGGIDVGAAESEDPAAPTLTLDGLALFGGVAVKAGASGGAQLSGTAVAS